MNRVMTILNRLAAGGPGKLDNYYERRAMLTDFVGDVGAQALTGNELFMLPAIWPYLFLNDRRKVIRQLLAAYLEAELPDHAILSTIKHLAFAGCESAREKQTEYEVSNRHHSYIGYGWGHFIKYINPLQQLTVGRKSKFIDVGAGIGDKVLLAHLLGFDAHGVEYNQTTYALSRHFLRGWGGWGTVGLYRGDALELDYSSYDVIYMFIIMANGKRTLELYTRIMSMMPIGGIMFDVACCEYTLDGICEYANISVTPELREYLLHGRDHPLYVYRRGDDEYDIGSFNEVQEWIKGGDMMIEKATLEELLQSKWCQITEDDCFVEGECPNCTSHCPANDNPEYRVSIGDPRWNYSNRDDRLGNLGS